MNLENYFRTYDKIVETLDEEIDTKLREIRQQCVKDFIDRLKRRESEWDRTFRQLLEKSQEVTLVKESPFSKNVDSQVPFTNQIPEKQEPPNQITSTRNSIDPTSNAPKTLTLPSEAVKPQINHEKPLTIGKEPAIKETALQPASENKSVRNADPSFSNINCIKEFVRTQKLLAENRQQFTEFNTSPILKPLRNELNLFIRTHINAISNSDSTHLNTKVSLLTSLFMGKNVTFQDRHINASKHPLGQRFAMDLAAQTFVTVGIRLVNSVPAIAKSMASVINGIIIDNHLGSFKDLIIGHLQEQNPYLVPMNPNFDDFAQLEDGEMKFKIACGYNYDTKSQTPEPDEKYLIKMRSMTLLYACILVQGHLQLAWNWLASFLSLEPQPVITATILQAFLQEASKTLSKTYERQYNKIIDFIRIIYVPKIEEVTTKKCDKQSLIKLKNLLADNSNLISAPTISSIFGAIKY